MFVCQSPHTLKKKLLLVWILGFLENFCFGWEGHGLVSGSLLLVILGGGGLKFYIFWGEWLPLEFLVVEFYLTFSFFLNIFFSFFFLCETLIFFQHSLIHRIF